MFYSEIFSSPISSYNVKRLYGVNPANDPARALAIGIYPLTEAPAGYTALAYTKEGNSYTTVSSTVTTTEMEMISFIRSTGADLAQVREALDLIVDPSEPSSY